jgi:hypothetical protein
MVNIAGVVFVMFTEDGNTNVRLAVPEVILSLTRAVQF